MSTPPRGRPRSDRAKQAILGAAFELLTAGGYPSLSIEAVAQAAGVGKATIYRWWRSRAELALDAFFAGTEPELRLPETASARADFQAQIMALGDLLRGPRGRAFASMLGGARTDPGLAAALGEIWLNPRRRWGFARMARAIAEGQCRPGLDPGAALGLLYGPLYAPLLFGEPVPPRAGVEAYLELAFAGIFKGAD